MKLNNLEMLMAITFTACCTGLLFGFLIGDLNFIEIIKEITK